MKKLTYILFLISFFSIVSYSTAETIYMRDGKVVGGISYVKELDNYFLVRQGNKTFSLSKSRITKIISDSGKTIFEYKVLTAEKNVNNLGLSQYKFFVNNKMTGVGGWDSKGFFKVFDGNLPDGTYNQYFSSGKLERIFPIKDNELNGISKVFYKSGRVSREGNFVNGLEEGESTLYYKTGELKGKSFYRKGQKDGKTFLYYKSGKVKAEMSFVKGNITGLQKMYYDNGNLATEVNFKDGEKHGPFKQYFENGKIRIKGNFKYGKLDGTVTNYYESGRVKNEKIFSNGRILEGKNKI